MPPRRPRRRRRRPVPPSRPSTGDVAYLLLSCSYAGTAFGGGRPLTFTTSAGRRLGLPPLHDWIRRRPVVRPELTDELVAAAIRGEQDARGVVYSALAPSVLGYLRARGVDDSEAMTLDVFV